MSSAYISIGIFDDISWYKYPGHIIWGMIVGYRMLETDATNMAPVTILPNSNAS